MFHHSIHVQRLSPQVLQEGWDYVRIISLFPVKFIYKYLYMFERNSWRTEYLLTHSTLPKPKQNCSSIYISSRQFLNLSNIPSKSLQSAPRSSDDLWKCSDSVFFWGLRRLQPGTAKQWYTGESFKHSFSCMARTLVLKMKILSLQGLFSSS